MDVIYRKDTNRSFIILKKEDTRELDFRTKMLLKNKVKGLCELKLEKFNGELMYCYDVTGKVSMENHYARVRMAADDIRRFISSMENILDKAKDYMLDIDKFLIDFQFVYIDENREISFCYYPYNEKKFFESLKSLFNKIIQYTDHADEEAVLLAYGLQQLCGKESITVNELINFISGIKVPEKEVEPDIEKEQTDIINQQDVPMINNEKENVWDIIKKKLEVYKNRYRVESRVNYVGENECIYGHNYESEIEQKSEEETVLLRTKAEPIGVILQATRGEEKDNIIPSFFPCIVGKSVKSSDYVIDDNTISRVHIRISEEADGYYIEDLNSTNGTYINGNKIEAHNPKKIEVGDTINLSQYEYIVC